MINQLREKIYQELITLTNIAEVFDWIPQKLWWFPSIYFSFDRVESSFLSSNHNERIYYFTLNIFQELTTLWNNESEKILCWVLDEIIDRFDRSDLDGLASFIEAVGWNIDAVETDVWPALHGISVLRIHVQFSLK